MHLRIFVLICFQLLGQAFTIQANAFLSNLQVDHYAPLFTTYAAHLSRSEFTLDQGFHLVYYQSERGIEFSTDKAGDWGLLFKMRDSIYWETASIHQKPVITHSYPDLVKFYFQTNEEVRVDALFHVYSSRIAILYLDIRNLSDQEIELEWYSYLHNPYRVFNDFEYHPQDHSLTFLHEEFPDNWMLNHAIPYANPVYDVWAFSDSLDAVTTLHQFHPQSGGLPQEIDLQRSQHLLLWGRIDHEQGGRCRHDTTRARFQIFLNDDYDRLLTESAPRWGNADENVNASGFYGVELGNFGNLNEADRYHIRLRCMYSGEEAEFEETISEFANKNNIRRNLLLRSDQKVVDVPTLKSLISPQDGTIRLHWTGRFDQEYHIYRRIYGQQGFYERIGAQLTTHTLIDSLPVNGLIHGYVLLASDEEGCFSIHSNEVTSLSHRDFVSYVRDGRMSDSIPRNLLQVISARKRIHLGPKESRPVSIGRGFARDPVEREQIQHELFDRFQADPNPFIAENEAFFSNVPILKTEDAEIQLLYHSAFNLMCQVMLPAEGRCGFNYYVFSREPTWGWGHGGQVFHESITMLAYAFLNPIGAMDSQRIYRERQYDNGYINYRTGPYLDEIIEYAGELTSSAPWYAWLNWEVFTITNDHEFLKEMYESSKQFYHYYISNRDKDGDGLCEWGGHAVLESVRDAYVAVWDEVGWPSEFEALDLNCMLVMEADALAQMAETLSLREEAEEWRRDAQRRRQQINVTFWDEQTGFYYHVSRDKHTFSHQSENDLKRMEIIGFLPLWAGIASPEQAGRLVDHLTDERKFWRPFGIPSLAADDPYYNDKGYWNGPVWVQWNYLIMRGLINYGYNQEATELVGRVARGMIEQLKKDHNFWEFYSPDEAWAGYHKTYIWAGIINRMLLDIANLEPNFWKGP